MQGDSGGPLTWADATGRRYLAGLVSVGVPCLGGGVSVLPGVYTSVPHYRPWIDSVLLTE